MYTRNWSYYTVITISKVIRKIIKFCNVIVRLPPRGLPANVLRPSVLDLGSGTGQTDRQTDR